MHIARVTGRLHGGTFMSFDPTNVSGFYFVFFLLEVVSKDTLSITACNFSATFLIVKVNSSVIDDFRTNARQ